MTSPNDIFKEALALQPERQAELIDRLLSNLDKPDEEILSLWIREAESRIDAYERGALKALSLETILEKYRKSV